MKKAIKINDWKVSFYANVNDEEIKEIQSKTKNFSPEARIKINDNLINENRGTTIARPKHKCIMVIIGKQSSKSEMLNTLSHEIRHVVDILCQNCNIENAAEITGNLTAQFADLL